MHEILFTTIERIRKPVIAAVQGAALAGGTGLAANAHVVIAAPGTRFGLTEIRIGLWPVLIFRAVALAIGERRATELSLTGRIIEAEEALRFGLVTEIAEDPLQRAKEVAATVAGYSPFALKQGLEYTQQIRHADWAHAGKLGRAMRNRLMASPDFQAGLKAFFEKRR
jgi:enoyl-CoA hydratase/carnithine racemase